MNNNSMEFNESSIHQMVYTFDLIELRTILRCIPNQVVHGDKSTLCNRLIYLLTSSSPQKLIVITKIREAYQSQQAQLKSQQTQLKSQKRALVNQSSTPPISNSVEPIFGTINKTIQSQNPPLVNQSSTPPIPNSVEPIFGTINETIQFSLNQPFFKTIKTLLQPMYCPGNTACIEFEGHYHINKKVENYISQKKIKIEIILRLEQFGLKSFNGHFPRNVNVSINDHKCFLGNMHFPQSTQGNVIIPYQLSVPIELTKYSNLKTYAMNILKVSWSNEPHSYVAGVYVVQKLTWEKLLEELQNRPLRASEKTKTLIKESMKNETDMGVDSMFTTIKDPISRLRMTMPVRGVDCIHLQCFDAIHFLQLNEKKQTWSCPLCNKQVKFENMEVDEFFLNIVQSPLLSKECENIILFKNATWTERKNNSSTNNNQRSTNNNEIIALSDSDDSS